MVIKIIIGVNLITYATRRQAGMDGREAADVVNNFGRDPIGEGEDERVSADRSNWFDSSLNLQQKYNKNLKKYLDDTNDDSPRLPDMGENKPGKPLSKKERLKLEDLTRYTMVKRIW